MPRAKKNIYDNVSPRIVKVIPLGGLEQIGMNMTVFEYGQSLIVVDAGLAFPGDNMPGVDFVLPDITYLKENQDRIKGFFFTHGHEDHIGAVPYVLKEVNAPMYGTKLTMALIESKLEEREMKDIAEIHVVQFGDVIDAGDFTVEFIRINHSIPDACALALRSPAGTILHTGDFKVDFSPIVGESADLQRLAEIGKEGVLALLSDSTNALRPAYTPSEQLVRETFDSIFSSNKESRILVATFASNLNRVQLVIDSAAKFGRKVAIEGRSMINAIEIARQLGYIRFPDNVLVDIETVNNYPDSEMCILMTGSQGEAMAALSRVANGQHRKISITPNDTVVFSSTPIPGNEKAVSDLINEIAKRGAAVQNKATHVSGHACEEELKLIYALTNPMYAVPVHGEFRHRQANAKIAEIMSVPKDHVILINSGDILELSKESAAVTGEVPHGGIMVDGLGIGDVGNIVLRDRQNLAEEGIIIVAMSVQRSTGQLLAGPELISRGFVYVRESVDLMEGARKAAQEAAERCLGMKMTDWGRIKTEVREALGSYVWRTVERNPVIIPIIMEIS
ncbi:MAG: ribonuclease J [Lachnospiraceae bacterium]|nr:ribonuclease J [Lachnospiraceae bacterium]